MIKLIQGFDVSSPLPIDGRIILSREEMASINDNIMPDKYFCICEEDGLLYLYDKNAEVGDNGKFYKAVPEKTSEIENNGNGDLVEGQSDPFDTVASVDAKVAALDQKIDSGFVDNDELADTLANYGLTQTDSEGTFGTPIANNIELVCKTEEEYGSEADYRLSVILKDFNGNEIVRSNIIDLPVENVVMDVDYVEDSEGKAIIIKLNSGAETRVPVDAIIEGLVNETTFNAHVNNVYNPELSNAGHLHIVEDQAKAWDAKYDLPEDGIPYEDMSAGVKESLDLADTALQKGNNITNLENDAGYVTPSDLIDGNNITIDETSEGIVISAKDTTYEAGRGIRITTGSQGNDDSSSDTLYISALAAEPTWVDIDSTSEVGPRDNEALNEAFNEVEDLIALKQDKIQAGALLDADLVDDTTSAHKFVTTADKTTWNTKQNALQAGDNISLSNDTVSVTGLSDVALSGSYADLANKPQINGLTLSGNIQSSSLGLSYNDLSNRPTIGNRALTINVADAAPATASTTFTANQSQNDSLITVNVPFRTSQIQNTGHGRVNEDAETSEESYYGYVDSYEMDQALTSKISDHNTSNSAHNDIRTIISSNNTAAVERLNAIEGKIPSNASSSNQLADKEFVNSSIATNTAIFRGTYETVNDLPTTSSISDLKNNDYAFVIVASSEGNPEYQRYKYSSGSWVFEYTLNNSSFTADQWAAINSGITSDLIPQDASSTNQFAVESEIANLQSIKQDTLVSGTDIKTINNNSVLGAGNLSVGTISSVQIQTESPITINSSNEVTSGAVNRTISHAAAPSAASGTSGYTTYGATENQSVAAGSSFSVPYIVTDTTGHVSTGSSTRNITLPAAQTAAAGYGLELSSNAYQIKRTTLSIASGDWAGSAVPYTAAITLTGATTNSMPICDVNITSTAAATINSLLQQWGYIYRAVCTANTITFYATAKPSSTLSVKVIGY